MFVEEAAYHLAVLRPVGERDRRAVNPDEAFTIVANRREKGGALLVVHFEGAAGV